MTRRLLLFLLTAGLLPSASAVDRGESPNVIFIMADDMGYADAGCYGGKVISTPNIDRLAAEGTRFTQCYAGATVCAPSRSVLMTGLHGGHTRVRGNTSKVAGVTGLGGKTGRVPLEDADVTVAEVLKSAGYATGMAGKWGLGEPKTSGLPNAQGFDEWVGFLNQRRAHSYYPEFIWNNQHKVVLPGNADGAEGDYIQDLIVTFSLGFIKKYQDDPFFLYLPYTLPHAKLEIPDLGEYAEKPWQESEKAYAAMVTRLDSDVGRILSLLEELDLEDETLVFFCSDNGAADRWEGRFDSSGPLRGRKRDLYEGGLRVPMVVRWPGVIQAGGVSDAVWSFTDMMPTLAGLTGAELPGNLALDGVSVLPTLHGEPQPQLAERFLYWEFFERGFGQAARWGNWKALRKGQGDSLELYDLSKDIGEANDVAAANAGVVEKFEEFFKGARSESEAWPLD
ncbi:MAG: arylsulfatase [Verrucomicrobiales bacterium]